MSYNNELQNLVSFNYKYRTSLIAMDANEYLNHHDESCVAVKQISMGVNQMYLTEILHWMKLRTLS